MTAPLSKYVPVEDSEVRLRKVWLSVNERLDNQKPRRPSLWLPGLVGAVAIAALALWLLPSHSDELSPWTNATLETATDALHVDLHDGSRIELAAATRLSVDETEQRAVRIQLQKGRVDCDVRPNTERVFSVLAPGVEVRVTGTRFSVEVEESTGAVRVAVQRGSVDVRRSEAASAVSHVSAGETWTLNPEMGRPNEAPIAPEPEASSTPEVIPTVSAPPRSVGSVERLEHAIEEQPVKAPSAKDLLESANEARRRGDAREAANAYEQLLREYPGDGRAGLAAFELGRLRMDRLGDASGAVEALKRAITLAPGSGFREDAMARLVYAYSALGSAGRCQAARSDYLDRYPNGVHAGKVTRTCQK